MGSGSRVHDAKSDVAPVERAETPPSPSSTVPFRLDADFVSRGTIQMEIERRCADGAARVALVGIGGVG